MAYIVYLRRQQAIKLAEERGYGYFCTRTNEEASRELRVPIYVVALAREIAYERVLATDDHRRGFSGSKS